MELLIIIIEFFIILILINNKYEIKKGNKDQQEIKTRLHWLRENVLRIINKLNAKKNK